MHRRVLAMHWKRPPCRTTRWLILLVENSRDLTCNKTRCIESIGFWGGGAPGRGGDYPMAGDAGLVQCHLLCKTKQTSWVWYLSRFYNRNFSVAANSLWSLVKFTYLDNRNSVPSAFSKFYLKVPARFWLSLSTYDFYFSDLVRE